MRTKLLLKNTVSSLIFEIVTIICGFVLPRLILNYYGSEVNGLVNSITQFLQIIAFLELGVGAVVQSTLYKPLAEKNDTEISKIIKSASRFFNKLAIILSLYILTLIIFYPSMVKDSFSPWYTAILILAMSVSSFSQYYFGVVERLLLTADQRGYIQYNAQIVVLILNTALCSVFIICGASIQFVKLTTSLVYLLRPLYLRIYVNKHYNIDRKITYNEDPIKQKKNGIAQHIASVVLNNTDTIVLTAFSTLTNVSIYSVYHLVIYGVKQLFTSLTAGIQAILGELWAKQEIEQLKALFDTVEWVIHTTAVIIFGCTGVLILPFISLYTKGITDANYIQPLFAVLITLAHAGHCLRLPYNIMILAGGHYKQTQSNYIVAAIINIVISILTVKMWGLVGVAIGTLVAMLYQTIWMAAYDSKNFVFRPFSLFIKQCVADLIVCLISVGCTLWIPIYCESYFKWVLFAIAALIIWTSVSIMVNILAYRSKLKWAIRIIINKCEKGRKK